MDGQPQYIRGTESGNTSADMAGHGVLPMAAQNAPLSPQPQYIRGTESSPSSSKNASSWDTLRNASTNDEESQTGCFRQPHPNNEEEDEIKNNVKVKKQGSLEASLKKWKSVTLVLNATTRRFRCSGHANLDENEKQKQDTAPDILPKKEAQTCQSALRSPVSDGFEMSATQLTDLLRNRDLDSLRHLGDAPGISACLHTELERGIEGSVSDLEHRKRAFGSNTYPQKPPRWFVSFLWDACKDPTLMILMVCALLSLVFGIRGHGWKEGWYDGASIAFAVILVVFVTSTSDYKQSLQFRALNEEKRNVQVQVMRGGRRLTVSIFEIVVGDIVILRIGDQVPADGIFVQGYSLTIDESSMTGESKPVNVNATTKPFLLSGCKVSDGFGTMLVTGVGVNTEWGQLMAVIGEERHEETPLQVRLNGVASFIGKIGLIVAMLVLLILVIFYFIGHEDGANNSGRFKAGKTSASDAVNSVVDIFAISVTIIVVAVPEGLPLAVTLTLAYSMKKMMVDRALVRKLSACETMGGATCICTDKTGTLTLNQMNVVKAWVAGDFRTESLLRKHLVPDVFDLLLEGLAQNSSGNVFIPPQPSPEPEEEVTGSPTEKAVLMWGLKLGMDFEKIRARSVIVQVEAFNSTKKRGGVAVRSDVGKVRAHWKGAAEIVLNECESAVLNDCSTIPITECKRQDLLRVIEGMASESLRCIAFAYRDITEEQCHARKGEWKIPESGLCLIAMVGIKDPCRPGVVEAVKICRDAGIKVRMVTGDNIFTAKAIAIECGILDDERGLAIEGPTFRRYSDEERKAKLKDIMVMARSSPSDKLLMVKTLREMGHVVAVTGDGTNDALALHEANVGLAMGIQGTEVAKDSSDIIILDDNFASVVKVVRWGRSVYANIQKFIQFQLTVNVAALTINFVAALSCGHVPLNAVQLLWVNLIMDTLGALALATEPPSDELMSMPPVAPKAPIISPIMWRNILGQALYQIVVLLVLQFRGKDILSLTQSNAEETNMTIIFNAFVLCQLFNEVNARKPNNINIFEGIKDNHLFIGILFATMFLQVIIVEFLNKFATTISLKWQHWLISIAIGSISWPLGALLKILFTENRILSVQVLYAHLKSRSHHLP